MPVGNATSGQDTSPWALHPSYRAAMRRVGLLLLVLGLGMGL